MIWVKGHSGPLQGLHGRSRVVLHGWPRRQPGADFFGPTNAVNVVHRRRSCRERLVEALKTEKPVEIALAALPMLVSERPVEEDIDLFSGSGSTLIAAPARPATALLMELDPLAT